MINQDKYILIVVCAILIIYLIWRFNFSYKEDFNSLYNYSKLGLGEELGTGMFAGGDEVFVYEVKHTPITGVGGKIAKKTKMPMPMLGFKSSEVKKIPNFEKAVKTEKNIEYVDNNLMVPLLYHLVKRLVIMFGSLQDQITECCHK
jgi:hypothetical protein